MRPLLLLLAACAPPAADTGGADSAAPAASTVQPLRVASFNADWLWATPGGGEMPRNAVDYQMVGRLLTDHGVADPAARRTLAELIGPGDGEQSAPTSLSNPFERYRLLTRLLGAIAGGPEGPRPLVVVLDDAQWSPDALGLAHHLLEHAAQVRLPVLLVLVVLDLVSVAIIGLLLWHTVR